MEKDEYTFEYLQNGTVKLLSYNGDEEHVIIPREYKGETVTVISSMLFSEHRNNNAIFKNKIKTISFPGTISEIPENICQNLNGLTQITVSEGIERIGQNAFFMCHDLKNADLPQTLLDIKPFAFAGCINLRLESFPSGIEQIGEAAFNKVPLIETLTLPDTMIGIGSYAFSDTGIKTLIMDSSLVYMHEAVFYGCNDLTYVEIKDPLGVLPASTFAFCKNLKTVLCPDALETIGERAFAHCKNLESFYVGNNIKYIDPTAFKLEFIPSLYKRPLTFYCAKNSYTYQWARDSGFNVRRNDPTALMQAIGGKDATEDFINRRTGKIQERNDSDER